MCSYNGLNGIMGNNCALIRMGGGVAMAIGTVQALKICASKDNCNVVQYNSGEKEWGDSNVRGPASS